jgi:hypothetical protein
MADDIFQLEIAAKRIYLETFELVLQTGFPCSNLHDSIAEKAKAVAKECSIALGDCFATAWLARPAYWFAIENVVMRDDSENFSYRQPMTVEKKVELRKEYAACYEREYMAYMLANLKNAKNFKS